MDGFIETTKRARIWVLLALSGSLALAFLDQMNLPVALPTIQKELGLSTLTVQWIINSYLLSWAVFVLTGGYLADYFGLRRIFCIGVFIFAIGSFTSAIANVGWWFILSRAVQGFGTALMLPSAIGILVSIYPKNEQGKAIGIYSGIAAIFLVLGPLMGGAFTQFLSWRWIFWVNVPIALASLIVTLIALRVIPSKKIKFDFLGFIFFTMGFPCFILALMQGNRWGWTSPSILGLFASSILALWILFRVEIKAKLPFLDLKLFKTPSFLGSNIIFFVVQFILILPVYWAMFLQRILGYSPLAAGIYVMIAVIPLIVIIPLGGILSDHRGYRFPVLLGLFLTSAALLWFFICGKLTLPLLLPGMIVFGVGVALVFAPISACVVGGVCLEKRGVASGVLGCIRQVGGTIGMAAISAMLTDLRNANFFQRLMKSPYKTIPISEDQLECFYIGTGNLCEVSGAVLKPLQTMAIESYFFAFRWVYFLCATLVVIAIFVTWKTISSKPRDYSA